MLEQNILHSLTTEWAGKQMVFLDSVDSTNDHAKRLANEGAPHGTLVVAETQVAGKGRMGRNFDSPKNSGIWMSLIIKDEIEPVNASMLTLVMGLATARAVNMVAGLNSQIKWPNDLILNGKKLAGILTEMTLRADGSNPIIIGVGINVLNDSFSEEIRQVATSVFLESRKRIDRASLIDEVLKQFERYYHIYMQTQDLSTLVSEYNDCLINRGRWVQVLEPKGTYEGRALGINAEGELLVEVENEVRQIASGEVSVRGVLGYV